MTLAYETATQVESQLCGAIAAVKAAYLQYEVFNFRPGELRLHQWWPQHMKLEPLRPPVFLWLARCAQMTGRIGWLVDALIAANGQGTCHPRVVADFN
jgi:hypothetical protein